MEKKVGVVLLVLSIIFLINFISAAPINNSLHLNIQTLNSTGGIISGTFVFGFNISQTSDCSTANILYTNHSTLTTDSRGIISHYLENINLNFSDQYWLCYYRDGTLISTSKIARSPYAFRAQNITLSGIESNSNFNTGIYNISSSWFFGLFDWIINATGMNSNYLNFNGSDLSFNEGKLNETIDNRLSTSSTTTQNYFNQQLNTTSNVTFNNLTISKNFSADTGFFSKIILGVVDISTWIENISRNWTSLANLYTDDRLAIVNNSALHIGEENRTKLYCGNITGATSNLCTLTPSSVDYSNLAWINQSNIFVSWQNFSVVNATSILMGGINLSTWIENISRNWTLFANTYTDGRIIAVNTTAQQALTINTTANIQELLNSTGIYSTYNATYEANIDTNCSNGNCAGIIYWANGSLFNQTGLINSVNNSALSINTTKNIQELYNSTALQIAQIVNNSALHIGEENRTKLYCGNITGASSDLCTVTPGGNTSQEIRNAVNDSVQYKFTANRSDNWDTLNTYNATQMEQSEDKLNIKESWLDSLYIKTSNLASTIVSMVGNWSADKNNYYTKSETDLNLSNYNISNYNLFVSFNTTANVQNLMDNSSIARTGNCSAGELVMNITNVGVQCVAVTLVNCDDGHCANVFYWANSSLLNETDKLISINNSLILINNTLEGKITSINSSLSWFNETNMILSVNTTANIQELLNSTGIYQNSFVANLTQPTCSAGTVVSGVNANGSVICTTDLTGGANWFDQQLNTTSNVTFYNITANGNLSVMGNIYYGNGIALTAFNTTTNIQGLVNSTYVPYEAAIANVHLGIYNLTTTGRIGIGTNNPQRNLQLNGAGTVALQITNAVTGSTDTDGFLVDYHNDGGAEFWNFENTNMWFGTNNARVMTLNTSGYVGIGTATPAYRLDVSGTFHVDAGSDGASTGGAITVDKGTIDGNGGNVLIQGGGALEAGGNVSIASGGGTLAGLGNVYIYGLEGGGPNLGDFGDIILGYNGSHYAGNVGVNTTNPASLLSVNGIGNSTSSLYSYSEGGISVFANSTNTGIYSYGGDKGIISYGTNYDFYAGNAGASSYFAGKVGIGTTSPDYALEINQSGKALNVSGLMYVNSTHVRIGVLNPSLSALGKNATLLVYGTNRPGIIQLQSNQNDNINNGGIITFANSGGTVLTQISGIGDGFGTGYVDFSSYNAANWLYARWSMSAVQVGINTPTPSATFNVVGTTNFTSTLAVASTITAGTTVAQAYNNFGSGQAPDSGQITNVNDVFIHDDLEVEGTFYLTGGYAAIGNADVAENLQTIQGRKNTICEGQKQINGATCVINATRDLDYGDVVCIDTRYGQVIMKCNQSNSKLIAGVVSNTSVIQMGNNEKYAYPIAVAGVVWTKVSNENGHILPGDLLVSASKEGYAMKAGENNEVGTVLGKAFDFCDYKYKECIIPMFVALG